ncbi:MAG: hypothetical protein Tsb008_18350 [Rhodothalassiaceae bacterium]
MNAQQAHEDRLVRLEVQRAGPDVFDGYWNGERIVARSRTPLLDAARALKARGIDTSRLMTMRHVGSTHDSFIPKPVEHWAGIMITENDKNGFQRRRYKPHPRALERATWAKGTFLHRALKFSR